MKPTCQLTLEQFLKRTQLVHTFRTPNKQSREPHLLNNKARTLNFKHLFLIRQNMTRLPFNLSRETESR